MPITTTMVLPSPTRRAHAARALARGALLAKVGQRLVGMRLVGMRLVGMRLAGMRLAGERWLTVTAAVAAMEVAMAAVTERPKPRLRMCDQPFQRLGQSRGSS